MHMRTSVFILLLVLSGTIITSCVAPERENIDVMTFNIRYDNPDDGMFSWDSRKEMVFWLIEKYDPDILGVQEALKGQMDELDEALSSYRWSGAGRDDGDCAGEYVPVFFKKDRFMLSDEGQFWLSEEPARPGSMGWDAACTRMVSWITLKEISTGYEYFVFNTHFDHVGEEARLRSAQLLSDSVRTIASLKPVIIMGDFNCSPDSDPLNILSHLFTDARLLAVEKDSVAGTTFVGFPADLAREDIIDHIFISPHFGVDEYEIIADNANGFFPSDHLPVLVSLKLRMP
jgi:endonuclease/exonuclease/phosphatase family metal-dependent hydrolase